MNKKPDISFSALLVNHKPRQVVLEDPFNQTWQHTKPFEAFSIVHAQTFVRGVTMSAYKKRSLMLSSVGTWVENCLGGVILSVKQWAFPATAPGISPQPRCRRTPPYLRRIIILSTEVMYRGDVTVELRNVTASMAFIKLISNDFGLSSLEPPCIPFTPPISWPS